MLTVILVGQIVSMKDHINVGSTFDFVGNICNIDADQTKPLIITGHSDGFVNIWNYDTQILMGSNKIPNIAAACSVKFIARKGWFLVGSSDGFIHVYNYEKEMRKIKSFRVYNGSVRKHSLAIHPTKSYVLSACNRTIKLLDWENGWFGWKCMQTFNQCSRVCALAFNAEDHNSFANASDDKTIKVWSLDSPKYVKRILSGHSMKVNCLDFFSRDGQHYLISGSDDKTAKIWDLQTKECVHTLPHNSEVISVVSRPSLLVLVTGTYDGDVCLWSSTNFRLKRILNIDGRSLVTSLACLNESGRLAVAHESGLSVIEIPDEEEQGDSSGNNENSISVID